MVQIKNERMYVEEKMFILLQLAQSYRKTATTH